jgi:hypothetical protein
MILYLKDTKLGYGEISDLLNKHIGPAGPDTWQNITLSDQNGAVQIYETDPKKCGMVWFIWFLK